jgi:site-specific DNA-methyltransferase (adenine-specific)
MPENTDHPTQKSEKLLAKLMLASTNPGDFVLDPFLGSGTTSVVAKKLKRRFLGIECDETFALLAAKRLEMADEDAGIQGFADGVFWERNTLAAQRNGMKNAQIATRNRKSLVRDVAEARAEYKSGQFRPITASSIVEALDAS